MSTADNDTEDAKASRDYSGEFSSDNARRARVKPRKKADVLRPNHAQIGIPDEPWEHEDERLNPGANGGSQSGASGDKPKAPSNSA